MSISKINYAFLSLHKPLIFRYVESLHKIILHYSKIYYLADTSNTSLVRLQITLLFFIFYKFTKLVLRGRLEKPVGRTLQRKLSKLE
jgi:hypothetical protein